MINPKNEMVKSAASERGVESQVNAVPADTIPQFFKGPFMQAGLVQYRAEEFGRVLVRSSCVEKMREGAKGKPIVFKVHRDISTDEIPSEASGVVIDVWPEDGVDWCRVILWDREAIRAARSGKFGFSCSYLPTVFGPAGIHNDVPYDMEFLDGEYQHIAIVDKPRYEEFGISASNSSSKTNSKTSVGDKKMGLSSLWKRVAKNSEEKAEEKKDEKREVGEEAPKKLFVEVDGKKVSVEELIAVFEKEAKSEDKSENSLSDDDEIEIGGKKVSVGNLKEVFGKHKAKNADAPDEKKKEKQEEKDEKNDEKSEKERIEDEKAKAKNSSEAPPEKKDAGKPEVDGGRIYAMGDQMAAFNSKFEQRKGTVEGSADKGYISDAQGFEMGRKIYGKGE